MTKASDNDFPSILLTEQGSAPTSPAASHQRLYIRTSDHKLVTVNSSGTVAPVDTTGGGGFAQSSRVTLTSGDLTTTSTTFTDATGLTTTITTGATRCMVMATFSVKNSGAGQVDYFDIAVDGTRVGQTGGLLIMSGTEIQTVTLNYLTNVLSAASHTIKVQWKVSAGTGTIWAGTTNTPAILTVLETNLTS